MTTFRQLALTFPEPVLPLLTVNEIFENADQSLLEKLKEDRRLERKPAGYHSKALGDYFSMFANTKPDGGLIIIGQENDGTFSGCSRATSSHINDLERTADNHCSDARFELKRVSAKRPDGTEDYVLLIRVFYRQDKLVRTHSGDAFIRSGESKKKLTSEEAREIEIDKGQLDIEQEPCRLSFPQDFDMELVRQFVNSFKSKRGLSDEHSTEKILELNHLGKLG
ncbi:MAG: AlbA family DNA-binding domain-containing protein, partial [Pyrinomonadaceae bacterium]